MAVQKKKRKSREKGLRCLNGRHETRLVVPDGRPGRPCQIEMRWCHVMRSTNEAIPRVPPGLEGGAAAGAPPSAVKCLVSDSLVCKVQVCVATGQRWQGFIYNDDGFPSLLCSLSPQHHHLIPSRLAAKAAACPCKPSRHLPSLSPLLTVVNTWIKMCFSSEPRTKYYYREEIIPAPRRHYHHHGHGHHHHHHHSPRVSYSSVTRRSYHSPRISASSHKAY